MSGGVIKPWVSQEKQIVSGGGQVASFKGASDFMAPGGGDNGLAALAKGLGQLGGAIHEEGLRRNKAVFDLTMQNEQNEYFAEMNKFIDDFKLNNKGVNAAQATAAFEAWNQERADAFIEKYGKNDNARLFAAQHLGTMAAKGLDHMRDYEYQQLEAGLNESYQAGQSLLLNRMVTHPEEASEIIPQLMANAAAEANRKGTTPEARALQSQAMTKATLLGAINALVESGDTKGSEDFFQSSVQGARPSGPTAGGGGTARPYDGEFRISSRFGPRGPIKGAPGASRDHKGIDIAMPVGTPVKAMSGGEVVFAGNNGKAGLMVTIRHDDGSLESQALHLSELAPDIRPGARVEAGQEIAKSGNSGNSSGPHLDFRVKQNGQYIDPEPFLSGGASGPPANPEPVMVASASTTGDTATDAGGITPGGEADDAQAVATSTASTETVAGSDAAAPAKDYKNHPWAEFFSAAELKEIDDKITAAKDDQMVKALTAKHAAAVDNNSEEEIAQANLAAAEEIKAATEGDPERRVKLLDSLAKNQQFADKERHLRDGVATEDYYKAAEGMTPLDRQKLLARDEWRSKFSRAGWGNLMRAEQDGPGNMIAGQTLDAFKVEIDRRNKGDGGLEPYTEDELKADAYAAGLTMDQVGTLTTYRANGGMVGVEGFAGKVKDIYLEYFKPDSDEYKAVVDGLMPPGFLNMVAEHLQPGTKPSLDEIRKAVAMATMRSRQGKSVESLEYYETSRPASAAAGTGIIGRRYGLRSSHVEEVGRKVAKSKTRKETAYEAIAGKRIDQWLPDVDSWEKKRIDPALTMAGIEANATTRSLWKKAEILGEELTDEEKKLIDSYKVR